LSGRGPDKGEGEGEGEVELDGGRGKVGVVATLVAHVFVHCMYNMMESGQRVPPNLSF